MKKIILLLVFFLAMTPGLLKAQNPIPSWNVPVYFRANFQELNKGISNQSKASRGKRVLHVNAQHGISGPVDCGTVWIYSLDSLNVIGPLQLCEGETLTIEIDENEWGVLVESEEHLVVDVWIEESKSPVKLQNKNPEYRTKNE